ncbi:hypothetical protein L226DRAFT_614246 [Lentinus tigrinus ALCF2SS1-7]|uniref:DUF6534 domain-containing protein n=1 Tax=Lentinus tigrinus ALCF2SS1-6 TaxID=1328759 RepID=A0A5C2S7B9_9APHY|nr:hypothetical protein L227DRAFT_654359 [Lentinus tigrinus ALCF2SS1-6]RPD73353.1 hypothetical protein L226DRAFT_614246 [Lentinus tigrinus ALCF2SS1-7]
MAATSVLPPFDPPTSLSLDPYFGAWLVGTFASATLQGVLFVQTYSYFRQYLHDPRFIKIWVVVVFVVELLTTIFSMHSCYFYLISNYFNFTILFNNTVWTIKIIPVLGGTVTLLTQLFLARRIYILKRGFRPIALVAVFLTVGLFACCIALSVLIWNEPNALSTARFSWLASASSCLILAADLMLTSAFIYFLRTSRSVVSRTNSLLDLFVLYAVSSGLVLCTVNIMNVVCALALPKTLAFSATSLVLTKLYSITFMVWLNAREPLRDRGIIMVETELFTSVITVDAQYPSEGMIEHPGMVRASRPTTTSLSLAALQNLSQSSGELGHGPDMRRGCEKVS